MIQDTILYSTDSLIELSDSLSQCDTTFTPDTINVVDTIVLLPKILRGVEGISHPSLPQTQDWTFIVLLLFYGIMIFSLARSSELLIETIKSFFQMKDRSSIFIRTTLKDFRFRIFLIIFSIGVLSLYAYIINNPTTSPFQLKIFGYFFSVTIIFFSIKYLLIELLGYIFLNSTERKIIKETYFNILSFLGLTVFPLLVFRIYFLYNYLNTIETIVTITIILAYVLMSIKLIQIFLHKILASFYILLYLCTLEILPLIILLEVYKLLI